MHKPIYQQANPVYAEACQTDQDGLLPHPCLLTIPLLLIYVIYIHTNKLYVYFKHSATALNRATR